MTVMVVSKKSFVYFGADPDDPHRVFWLPLPELGSHVWIIGATRAGKSNLKLHLFMQVFTAGDGCCLIDPKGDTVQDVLAAITAVPEDRWASLAREVVLIEPADARSTACFNPLELAPNTSAPRLRQDLYSLFRKVFRLDDNQTPRLGLVLRRALQLAIEHGLTVCDLQRLLTDDAFRAPFVARSQDETLRAFWEYEFPESKSAQLQWTASTLTRLETFLDDPAVRRFLGQPRSSFDFRRIMDEGKVLLINLAKGRVGEETSRLLGGFLLARLQLAAESRQVLPEESRRPFYVFVEEFQNYVHGDVDEMLTELRGYQVSLIMAHQHLAQLDDDLQRAVLSNARIRAAFRVSHQDAEILAREFWKVSGQRVKEHRWQTARLSRNIFLPVPEPVYFSAGDEVRQNKEALHYQPDRLFWLHVQGEYEPTLLRTVDMPRAELAAARERVERFKVLVAEVNRPARHDRPALEAVPARPRTFEWAGRAKGSGAAGF